MIGAAANLKSKPVPTVSSVHNTEKLGPRFTINDNIFHTSNDINSIDCYFVSKYLILNILHLIMVKKCQKK